MEPKKGVEKLPEPGPAKPVEPAAAPEKPIELPPTTADLMRQFAEFRDLTTRELDELRKKVSEMTPAEKVEVEKKIEKKIESTPAKKLSGDWLYDLIWS